MSIETIVMPLRTIIVESVFISFHIKSNVGKKLRFYFKKVATKTK